ncbi:hypothetical protein CPB84DRAFT_1958517 [Gymnopilus junonius]|uniref:Calcineurin-like phosphoesterase domain-containing protein n=1 Tax=Gymnopilus junonius TaxID=109634 RepID=A0A9P5NYR2_GYMJU|nr:hypothetical protein CPB84DRAFT_1958517 [Gymnopilus junonius]
MTPIAAGSSVLPVTPIRFDHIDHHQSPEVMSSPKRGFAKAPELKQRLKVLHLSDFHIDPRYATGAEANCTSGLCCRANNHNNLSPNKILAPAPRYGAYLCDTPISLALAALEAVPALTGTKGTGFAFTVYTGDLVSHDPDNQLGRAYIEYTETILYDLFKRMLGSGPVYPASEIMIAITKLKMLLTRLEENLHSNSAGVNVFQGTTTMWPGLWQHENWIPESAVELARSHYAATW